VTPLWSRSLAVALVVLSCVAAGPAMTFETSRGPARVRVEIVDTPEARERGLMGRASLEADSGMLFVWGEEVASAFWMKDTLIPLSVAFLDADGRVLRILDMEPCRGDPCPVYDPQLRYRMALEVDRGAFDRLGIRVGDRGRLVR
jgi:uncharacterized protein